MAAAAGGSECPEFSSTDAEVAQLRRRHGFGVRVIKDVGDFSHVLDVALEHTGITLKFQIEGTYPSVPAHIIVKSKSLDTSSKELLSLHLTATAACLAGNFMVQKLVDETQAWLLDHSVSCSSETSSEEKVITQKYHKTDKKNKKKNKKVDDDVVVVEKKSPMKTASEVISRVLWDESLQMENFNIGYIDRFLGVVEKNFTVFSWEDISSVDYDTLAIPKHRIQYFKYKNMKVWDKNVRLDNVFGSTGSGMTIIEAIQKYEEHNVNDTDEAIDDHDGTDDDDDDLEINLGAAGQFGEMELTGKDRYWGGKERPTHFLALRVTNPTVLENIEHLHDKILDMKPEYEEGLIPVCRLHITLCCLGLDTQDQVDTAMKSLEKIKLELTSHNPEKLCIKFGELDHFFDTTLYSKVEHNQTFLDLVDLIRICMYEDGVQSRDLFDFVPHMTIFKLSHSLAEELHCPYLEPRLYSSFKGQSFGEQIFNNIYLCEMSDDRMPDGFYVTPSVISF